MFRYAATASGPKDMILILDTSSSMTSDTSNGATRLEIMQEAASAVLDTLTNNDYATVIQFSTDAESYSNTLLSVTDKNRCLLENYIDNLEAGGITNYEAAFELAFKLMNNSIINGDITGCSAQVILFLTDGAITEGNTKIVELIEDLKNDNNIDFKILTYGIGDDLNSDDLSKLKDIACKNNGIYYKIDDINDNLSSTMASYYQLFVSLRETSNADDIANVKWIDYIDALTGYRLISANLPVYDKTTDPYTLLGVVVSDVASERLINTNLSEWGNDTGIYDDFDIIFNNMMNSSKQCAKFDFNYKQLETIRKTIVNSASCDTKPEGLTTGEIVLITLSSLVGFVLLSLLLCWLYNCRKTKTQPKHKNVNSYSQGDYSYN